MYNLPTLIARLCNDNDADARRVSHEIDAIRARSRENQGGNKCNSSDVTLPPPFRR
jgi:hypothetical protein